MSETWKIVILAVASYFWGNINVALLISKILKGDVRKLGSGNPGSMNMVRNYGLKIGILTLTLDAIKGALPTALGWLFIGTSAPAFTDNRLGAYIGAFCVILGHVFPVVLKFKGGKGIASSIGVCIVLQPIVILITFACAFVFILFTSMGSVSSFMAISVPLAYEGFSVASSNSPEATAGAILIFALFALTLFAHRKNVVRLFSGTESKTVILKKKKKSPEKPVATK